MYYIYLNYYILFSFSLIFIVNILFFSPLIILVYFFQRQSSASYRPIDEDLNEPLVQGETGGRRWSTEMFNIFDYDLKECKKGKIKKENLINKEKTTLFFFF